MDFRDAKYNHAGTIDCEINHPVYGWIPFTADPNDVEPYGREIFEALKSKAKPYVEYKPSKEELSNEARKIRDNLLKDLDFIVMNPLRWNSFSSNKQEQIAIYRQQLLDVPQQESFPISIDWPIKPDFI